jgi:hypothetical protein
LPKFTCAPFFFFDLDYLVLVSGSCFASVYPCCLQEPLLTDHERQTITDSVATGNAVAPAKFFDSTQELEVGEPATAALGLKDRLQVPDILARVHRGVEAIQDEVDALAISGQDPNQEVQSWLNYICKEKTSEAPFSNGIRDQGRPGMELDYFVMHPNARTAGLSAAHVVALRLYTTPAFSHMNNPLRNKQRCADGQACPLPVTTYLADEAIRKLRAVNSSMPLQAEVELWRGMQNRRLGAGFEQQGGTELAFLSTTSDLRVALAYSLSQNSLFFKIVADSWLSLGVDVQWLSAFPAESEKVYPPLTFLKPTGRTETLQVERESRLMSITVVEVRPIIP